MALVVEDGSGNNPDANSYADLSEIRTYATARNVDLPAGDAEVEAMAIKAMDYIEAQRERYQGQRTSADQPLQFPRYGLQVDGFNIGSGEIPANLVNAQCALVIESNSGQDLQPTVLPSTSGPVTKEKVAKIEVEYAEPDYKPYTPAFAKAEALLAPLYKKSGLTLVRV